MAYSLPAAQTAIAILSDPKKIPLLITSDIMVGETSTYADYVFPDLTYLARWLHLFVRPPRDVDDPQP